MKHAFVAVLMIGLVGVSANGQQSGASQHAREFPDKPELMRRIALYESLVQSAHVDNTKLAKLYLELGGLYGDAALYAKAEDAMRHGISLLRNGPQDELAGAIGHLAVLHIAMGELRDAEKEELEALRIRESVGEPTGIAQAWSDLADVYVKGKRYTQAVEYAQKAMNVLGDDPKVDIEDRIVVRQTLGYALCLDRECARGLPLLKDSIEMSKSLYGADSLEVGVAYYLLGYAAWQSGDMNGASEWMGRGIIE